MGGRGLDSSDSGRRPVAWLLWTRQTLCSCEKRPLHSATPLKLRKNFLSSPLHTTYHPNNVCWRILIMKLSYMQFPCLSSVHILHCTQDFVCTLPLWWETKCHSHTNQQVKLHFQFYKQQHFVPLNNVMVLLLTDSISYNMLCAKCQICKFIGSAIMSFISFYICSKWIPVLIRDETSHTNHLDSCPHSHFVSATQCIHLSCSPTYLKSTGTLPDETEKRFLKTFSCGCNCYVEWKERKWSNWSMESETASTISWTIFIPFLVTRPGQTCINFNKFNSNWNWNLHFSMCLSH